MSAPPDTGGGGPLIAASEPRPADRPRELPAPPLDQFGLAELRRLVVIAAVLSACILVALVRRLRPHATRPSWSTAASQGVVEGFVRLGPTFVKLGQLIASSPGVFPKNFSDAALRCLDEVPAFSGHEARDIVEAELGSLAAVFADFDDVALSAGSVGQVHACTLADGRKAVVKVQRPGIAVTMAVDLRVLHGIARLAVRTRTGRSANVVGVVEDLHAKTFQEMQPPLEAWRQDQFRQNLAAFGDNAELTAPEIYWDHCGPDVICMERLSGTPLDEFERIKAKGLDGELLVRRCIKGWIESCLVHGLFHGDVHAGNIWLLDDDRLAFLDFGIMGELPDGWRQLMRTLLGCTVLGDDFSTMARAFKDVGAFPEDAGTDEEVGARLVLLTSSMLDQGLADVSIVDALKTFVAVMEQNTGGAGAPKELVLVMKQLLYFERYAKELAPNWTMARDPYLLLNVFPDRARARATELGLDLPA